MTDRKRKKRHRESAVKLRDFEAFQLPSVVVKTFSIISKLCVADESV